MSNATSDRPLRILFIAPYVPSLVRVRPYNLIKSLAERGHRISLCVPVGGGREAEQLAAVAPFCEEVVAEPLSRLRPVWNCAGAFLRGRPLQAAYCYLPALQRRIDERLNGDGATRAYDVVHVEHLRAALFAWNQLLIPHVFDAVDCISQLFSQTSERSWGATSRLVARFDLERTRRFEREIVRRFARILATSEPERQALLELGEDPGAAARLEVVANGVDLDYFRPREVSRDPATLVYAGRMSYHANVTAVLFLAREVLPRVRAKRPDARLLVLGEDPHREVRRLAREQPGSITMTGALPDLRPHLAAATVSVAPVVYGVGVQNKVLEAMAMGTPVVCSPASCAALSARDGEDLLVAADAESTAAAILRLLGDAELRGRLGAAGRTYVERHHDWRQSAAQLEMIYRAEIAKKQ